LLLIRKILANYPRQYGLEGVGRDQWFSNLPFLPTNAVRFLLYVYVEKGVALFADEEFGGVGEGGVVDPAGEHAGHLLEAGLAGDAGYAGYGAAG
jgi:hypothetical protein